MSAQAVPNGMIASDTASELSTTATTPVPASTDAAQGVRCKRYDQMAKAASAGLMAHPQVESAIVEISGDEADLVFHLQCTVKTESDPADIMQTVSQGVIPNIERLLGTSFAARRLHFNRSLYSGA